MIKMNKDVLSDFSGHREPENKDGSLPRDLFEKYILAEKTAVEVFNILTSRKYSRAPPTNPNAMIENIIESCIETNIGGVIHGKRRR
ncbi:MAG: hypothetical protein V1743_02580, partial [Nanoarchaeota archaeon]